MVRSVCLYTSRVVFDVVKIFLADAVVNSERTRHGVIIVNSEVLFYPLATTTTRRRHMGQLEVQKTAVTVTPSGDCKGVIITY